MRLSYGSIAGQEEEDSEMKRTLGIAAATAFSLVAAISLAQTTPPAGGTMHEETTTTHKGKGKNTKMKTETVVGTVKEYEAGKKIVVTGPKDKEYSFDLDTNVGMEGTINTGEKVKVTYTKGPDGNKVTTIAPYKGKMGKKHAKKAA
jgi:hypothetical protein